DCTLFPWMSAYLGSRRSHNPGREAAPGVFPALSERLFRDLDLTQARPGPRPGADGGMIRSGRGWALPARSRLHVGVEIGHGTTEAVESCTCDRRVPQMDPLEGRDGGQVMQTLVRYRVPAEVDLRQCRQEREMGEAIVGDVCVPEIENSQRSQVTQQQDPFVADAGPRKVQRPERPAAADMGEALGGDPGARDVQARERRQVFEMTQAAVRHQ